MSVANISRSQYFSRKERPKVSSRIIAQPPLLADKSPYKLGRYRKGKKSSARGYFSFAPLHTGGEISGGIATDLMPEWLAVADEFQIWIFFRLSSKGEVRHHRQCHIHIRLPDSCEIEPEGKVFLQQQKFPGS